LWETSTGNESHSHPIFGSVIAWFYQALGGIIPDETQPGFKHIIINPQIVDELEFVNLSYQSSYGEVRCNWEYKDGNLKTEITIPPNTTASVYIPGNKIKDVNCSKKEIAAVNFENDLIRYEIPSGEYTFYSKNISSIIKSPMVSIPIIIPSDSTLFLPDSIRINIKQNSKDGKIRYTLDGSEPTKHSKLFATPFIINKSTIIKAEVFKKGNKPGFTITSRISFIDSTINGVNYKYYKGAWSRLPNFDLLKPDFEGKVFNFDLTTLKTYADKFAVEFTSNISIDSDDIYTDYQ
jgi:hypothetical protein